ncbi:MAG: DUF4058 family protein [Pirellulales bacterium]
MPSPFPGMDPYLEGSMNFHHQFSAEIARQLSPKLLPKYVAVMAERFVLDEPNGVAIATGSLYPDVGVFRSGRDSPQAITAASTQAPLRLATKVPERVPHVSIEIRDVKNHRLVTAIEVLSPTNKRGRGRREYLAKRRRILISSAHLMEVDLLHEGHRVPMQQPLPTAPYFVLLSRVDDRPVMEVWPIQLEEQLPTVPVPLLPGDADVPLDLQLAFSSIYDLLGYAVDTDYKQPPPVRLTDEEQELSRQYLEKMRRLT